MISETAGFQFQCPCGWISFKNDHNISNKLIKRLPLSKNIFIRYKSYRSQERNDYLKNRLSDRLYKSPDDSLLKHWYPYQSDGILHPRHVELRPQPLLAYFSKMFIQIYRNILRAQGCYIFHFDNIIFSPILKNNPQAKQLTYETGFWYRIQFSVPDSYYFL